jgi:hypothetical protein
MGLIDFLINQSGLQSFRSHIRSWASAVDAPLPGDTELDGRAPFADPHYYSDSASGSGSDTEEDEPASDEASDDGDDDPSEASPEDDDEDDDDDDAAAADRTIEELRLAAADTAAAGALRPVEIRGMTSHDYLSHVVYSPWLNPYASGQTTSPYRDASYTAQRPVRYNIPGYDYGESDQEEEEEEEEEEEDEEGAGAGA